MAKKDPFGNYSLAEVQAIEAINYVVMAGKELFDSKGQMFFSQASAIRYYKRIFEECHLVLLSGNASQKRNARVILNNLHVYPVRIH